MSGGETWTEYAAQIDGTRWVGQTFRHRVELEAMLRNVPNVHIVGRTVTASDWLPVDAPDGAA